MAERKILPFELDETLYPIGFYVKHEGKEKVEIRYLKQRDFPSFLGKFHFKRLLNRGYIKDLNCFLTGVHCWLPSLPIKGNFIEDEKEKFYLSKDHASPKQIAAILGLTHKIENASNLVGVASFFNHKIGHVPLVLKLWLKKELNSIEYPRDELTTKNLYYIYEHIIRLQKTFVYDGLYPWQTTTYEGRTTQKMSQSIFNEMIQVDKEFLLIDSIKDSYDWLNEYDPSWIEKFRGE